MSNVYCTPFVEQPCSVQRAARTILVHVIPPCPHHPGLGRKRLRADRLKQQPRLDQLESKKSASLRECLTGAFPDRCGEGRVSQQDHDLRKAIHSPNEFSYMYVMPPRGMHLVDGTSSILVSLGGTTLGDLGTYHRQVRRVGLHESSSRPQQVRRKLCMPM